MRKANDVSATGMHPSRFYIPSLKRLPIYDLDRTTLSLVAWKSIALPPQNMYRVGSSTAASARLGRDLTTRIKCCSKAPLKGLEFSIRSKTWFMLFAMLRNKLTLGGTRQVLLRSNPSLANKSHQRPLSHILLVVTIIFCENQVYERTTRVSIDCASIMLGCDSSNRLRKASERRFLTPGSLVYLAR